MARTDKIQDNRGLGKKSRTLDSTCETQKSLHAGSMNWNDELEAWWQNKTYDFPGGLSNAVWHMPNAATDRMAWLEKRVIRLKRLLSEHVTDSDTASY